MHQLLRMQAFTFSTPAPSAPVPKDLPFTDRLGGKSLQEVAQGGSIESQLTVGHGGCALLGAACCVCRAGLPYHGRPCCTAEQDNMVIGPRYNMTVAVLGHLSICCRRSVIVTTQAKPTPGPTAPCDPNGSFAESQQAGSSSLTSDGGQVTCMQLACLLLHDCC